jgi:hypothetical protein
MTDTKTKIETIIHREYNRGGVEYPLAARQCLHWATVHREEILVNFLPDLKMVLKLDGKIAAAHEIAAIEEEIRTRLQSSSVAS